MYNHGKVGFGAFRGVQKKSDHICSKMIMIPNKYVYKITFQCNPILMNYHITILLCYTSLFVLFILMFHFIHHVQISARHQAGRRHPTTMLSTSSATDTPADCPPWWYKIILRLPVDIRQQGAVSMSITTAEGLQHHIIITGRLGTLCRSIRRLTAAAIAAEWIYTY